MCTQERWCSHTGACCNTSHRHTFTGVEVAASGIRAEYHSVWVWTEYVFNVTLDICYTPPMLKILFYLLYSGGISGDKSWTQSHEESANSSKLHWEGEESCSGTGRSTMALSHLSNPESFPVSKRGWSLCLPAVHSNNCSTQYLRRGNSLRDAKSPFMHNTQEGRECESLISVHGCTHQNISYQPQGGRRTNGKGRMNDHRICADLLYI